MPDVNVGTVFASAEFAEDVVIGENSYELGSVDVQFEIEPIEIDTTDIAYEVTQEAISNLEYEMDSMADDAVGTAVDRVDIDTMVSDSAEGYDWETALKDWIHENEDYLSDECMQQVWTTMYAKVVQQFESKILELMSRISDLENGAPSKSGNTDKDWTVAV